MSRRRRSDHHQDLDESIVHEVHDLRAQMGSLEERTTSMQGALVRIAEQLDRLASKVSHVGQTDMRLLVSAGSLVVAIVAGLVGVASWGPLQTLAEHGEELKAHRAAEIRAAEERGRAAEQRRRNAMDLEQLRDQVQQLQQAGDQ